MYTCSFRFMFFPSNMEKIYYSNKDVLFNSQFENDKFIQLWCFFKLLLLTFFSHFLYVNII